MQHAPRPTRRYCGSPLAATAPGATIRVFDWKVAMKRVPLAVAAGLILVVAGPAFAYHDTIIGRGGASIGAFLPIVVVVVLGMVGLGIWNRKKRKTKSKRKHKRR